MTSENIKRYNQNNNKNFIIPSTELRLITHQEPGEDVEIRICERLSYNNDNHCRSCNNWTVIEWTNDGRRVEKDGHLSPSGICPHCGGCSNCRNVRDRIRYGQQPNFVERDDGWDAGFPVQERIVVSPHQLSFSDEMKREIKNFFDRLPDKGENLQDPEGLNFTGSHDDNLNFYNNEGLGGKTIRNDFWIILNENCWNYFKKEMDGEIMAGDGTGMVYLQNPNHDFLVKRSMDEVLRFINENPQSTGETQTPPSPTEPHNQGNNQTEIEQYNDRILKLIDQLLEENDDIVSQGTEKYAILMSLSKEGEQEVREQMNIINEEKQIFFEPKEEGQDNQRIENQNQRQIDNYRNWLAAKRVAITKLEAIIINQPEPTDTGSQPKPNPSPGKPKNPAVENNKESQENIEELSRLSLDEAKIKAKKEIETLFDRYGVQVSQLDARLWEGTENWEKYLEALTEQWKGTKIC